MNTTTVGAPPNKSSEETVLPLTASGNANAGAVNPRGIEVVGVAAIGQNFGAKLQQALPRCTATRLITFEP